MRGFGRLLVGGLLIGLISGTGVAPTIARAAAPSLSADPNPGLRGERFTVSGKLTTKVVRPVELQRKSGKKWKKLTSGKTAATGRFVLKASTTAASVTVRVVAKKVKTKGKSYQAITTKSRVIKTVTASLSLAIPTTGIVATKAVASVAFTPARKGRPVRVEALLFGQWRGVVSGVLGADGRVQLGFLTPGSAGTYSYRVLAPAWAGLPAVASKTMASRIVSPAGSPSVITLSGGVSATHSFGYVGCTVEGGRITFVGAGVSEDQLRPAIFTERAIDYFAYNAASSGVWIAPAAEFAKVEFSANQLILRSIGLYRETNLADEDQTPTTFINGTLTCTKWYR